MTRDNTPFRDRYGPWALITGASSGIGAALSDEIAGRGVDVVLTARNAEALETIAGKLRTSHGVETLCVATDLAVPDGMDMLMAAIADTEIGLYVGNAGFGTAGPFIENDADAEMEMIRLNCVGLAALAHPLARSMAGRGKGGIILMSSIVAFQGVPNQANYAATKAYVQSLAVGLAAELAPHGVDVLSSAPGPVDTGFAARADMRMGGAAAARDVARATLNALGKSRTVRPGTQSKLLGYGLGTLPRALRTRILGQIMQGMTKHRHGAQKNRKS